MRYQRMDSEIYYKMGEGTPFSYPTESFIPTVTKETVETVLST